MDSWTLPRSVTLAGRAHPVHSDYRDMLQILAVLAEDDDPEGAVYVALALFFQDFEAVAPGLYREAWEALCGFMAGGAAPGSGSRAKLIDWEQDAPLIAGEVGRVAGCDVRALPYLHWFTFLGYFNGIGEGPLATVVAIRHKRAAGRRLEDWEREFYRENRELVDFRRAESAEETAEKQRLLARLRGEERGR